MTALALVALPAALAAAAVAVWRRPIVALYAFVVGLALHNPVMARSSTPGSAAREIDVVQAWKEALLAVALARVAADAIRERRLPFRPRAVDWLALAFALSSASTRSSRRTCSAERPTAKAILYGLRHALLPVDRVLPRPLARS